jgi:hypothetical protein
MKQIKLLLCFILISWSVCQKKPIQIEVYPSEIEEDNSVLANDNVF